MAKKTGPNLDSRDPAGEIIKRLLRVQSYTGNNMSRIFEDWLQLAESELDNLPAHLESAAKTGKLSEGSPDTQALWQRLRGVYAKPQCWDEFTQAFAILLAQSDRFWLRDPAPSSYGYDLVGRVYSEFSYKPGSGQYFTPWNVAEMMARMTTGDGADIESEVMRRLNAAGRAVLADDSDPRQPLMMATMLTGLMLDASEASDDERAQWATQRLLPLVLHRYDPVRISDPSCGSGIMLLASAFSTPAWIVQSGLVQYYGMDIDATCVRMARVNVMLYGLNGAYVKSALALSGQELAALPPSYAAAYEAAQEADAAGDAETVQALAEAVRQEQYLFDIDAFRAARPAAPARNGTGKQRPALAAEAPAFVGALFEIGD